MPQLTVKSKRGLLSAFIIFWCAAPVVQAQATFTLEQLQGFAQTHSCTPNHRLKNNTQYLAWMDVLGSLVDGSLPPASLLDCELPAYGFAATLTEGALEPDDWAGLRTDLLSRIDTGSFDIDPVQARIEQGYAAADYAATAFMLCQADQRCFENLLETDELVDRICPNPVPNGFDDTSPDFFELNLFYYGSDMRHFLPYLLTNCRLLSASDVDDELRPIFDTLMQALRMR